MAKEKNVRYFMAGTDDELQFGDMIELDFVGEEDGVTKHSHLELKFQPEFVDELLEDEIIEVKEAEDEESDDLIDFDDFKENLWDFREAVSADIEDINEKLRGFDKRLAKFEEKVATLEEVVRLLKPKKETASPKKK